MERILNVAEKNDAAKSLADIMSRGRYQKREGVSKYNKIYEFPYKILNKDATMVMTSVSGHLLNYEFLIQYKNWNYCNPLVLFDAPLQKNCLKDYEDIKRTLEREVRNCTTLIIWTDCDREGENIGHEIVEVCTKVKPYIKVFRATFSEITNQAVTRATNNLRIPDKNVVDAVDVRQELDLRIGAAFTRFQTLRLQRVFPEVLKDHMISYGSCQFPTLGFVVERYKQVQSFVPEPFWKIEVFCQSEEGEVKFNWKRQRLFDYNACLALYEHCIENPTMTVVDIQSKPKSKWRPNALDTVELEKLASRKLKISAKETMKIAEKLYTQGYISYPRTETNAFPKDFDLNTLVGHQTKDQRWGEFAQRILERGPTPRDGNKSDQAHPPIHPTKYTNNLQGNERTIYEFIVRHFLACCSQDAQGHETTVDADISGEMFTLSGLMIIAKNYLEVYPYDKWTDKNIPGFTVGQQFMPKSIEFNQGETSAPSLLTEADLIALMEKHGIGTDATHADHIETIKSRMYVGLEDGKFVPGELGMGLVEGYDAMGFEMSKPHLRAELEADLKRICLGQKNKDVVLAEQIRKYKEVFVAATGQANKIDDALSHYFGEAHAPPPAQAAGNAFNFQPLCKCSSCGIDMVIKSRRDQPGLYLACSGFPGCRNVMWFPQFVLNADVVEETCNVCTSHGSPMHKIKLKLRRDSIPFGMEEEMVVCVGGCDHDIEELLGARFPRHTAGRQGGGHGGGYGGHGGGYGGGGGHGGGHGGGGHHNASGRNNAKRTSNDEASTPSRPFTSPIRNLAPSNHANHPTSSSGGRTCINPDVSNNSMVCNCGDDARLLTVRKEGPNKGRQFYGCHKPQETKCNFFLWADNQSEAGSSSRPVHNSNHFVGSSQQVLSRQPDNSNNDNFSCKCDLPAKERVVQKEGPNKGRLFHSCPKPPGQGCDFFQWIDQNNRGDSSINSNRHKNSTSSRNNNGNNDQQENKKRRKCGICGEEGHTRKTCPHKR